jgi:uncharacterized protein
MRLREQIAGKRAEIVAIARRHGASNVRLFGSVVRGTDVRSSDIDFLVTLEPGRTLFDIAHLEKELAALLGCPVDVATDRELAGELAETVPREAMTIWAPARGLARAIVG